MEGRDVALPQVSDDARNAMALPYLTFACPSYGLLPCTCTAYHQDLSAEKADAIAGASCSLTSSSPSLCRVVLAGPFSPSFVLGGHTYMYPTLSPPLIIIQRRPLALWLGRDRSANTSLYKGLNKYLYRSIVPSATKQSQSQDMTFRGRECLVWDSPLLTPFLTAAAGWANVHTYRDAYS